MARTCVCGHSEDDHRLNGGECLEDDCSCTFSDYLPRSGDRLRARLRRTKQDAARTVAGIRAERAAMRARRIAEGGSTKRIV